LIGPCPILYARHAACSKTSENRILSKTKEIMIGIIKIYDQAKPMANA